VTQQFDLLVMGGGSGGLAHAQRAAEYGATVAVIERGSLGGTCVNVGCVPKKVMWYSAHHAHATAQAADFGFDITSSGHDWPLLKTRRDAYIARLNGIYANNLERRQVTLIRGEARFRDKNTVNVDGTPVTAKRIVIATGGYPVLPDIPGAALGITSDGFFELDERPQRVAVVGSGYIAVELAGVFQALGSETIVLIRKNAILRSFDSMLGTEARAAMEADGVRFETGFVPVAAEKSGGGIRITSTDGRAFGPFDTVLWAVGRAPATGDLDLAAAGVTTDDAGFVPVDEYQKTNIDNIFALGDVTGAVALTPVAIAAGRRLADRLYGGMQGRKLDYQNIATVVFTHPPIGTVGLTEQQARALYSEGVKVYQSRFTPLLYALGEKKVPQTRHRRRG